MLRSRAATWSIDRVHLTTSLGGSVGKRERCQRGARHQCGHPRAEVLRGDIGAGGVAQVVVDVGRLDGVRAPVAVEVLEQVLTVEAAAALDQVGDVRVFHSHVVSDATLADEAEIDAVPTHPRVTGAECREPEGPVGADVLLVADADHRALEQEHDTGRHRRARQVAMREVARATAPDRRQRNAEGGEGGELLALASGTPVRVVPVLLPTLGVATGGLHVPVGRWADPHVGPGRRDRERPDPRELGGVLHGPAGRAVGEPAARPHTPDALFLVADAMDPAHVAGGVPRLGAV